MEKGLKGLSRYAGYIEESIMTIFKQHAKKEERAVVYMINRLIKNYCNEQEASSMSKNNS
jgi:hypothetical protein